MNQLDKELRLAVRGESDGGKELPSADSAKLSDAEAAVVKRIEAELADRSRRLLGVASATDFNTLPQELEALASQPQTILTQFRGKKARAQNATQIELNNAHTDYERAYGGYRLFRRRHQLAEEPRYDTVFWRKIFWLTLLFCVEVTANGWVIGQASPGGLIEGWTTALMISILVVLTGTLIGMGPWRYLTYTGIEGKGRIHLYWAAPAVVVGCLALTFFAFYVAHYRYALSTTELDAPVPDHVLSSVFGNPFGPFEQLDSLILFVVAMLIGVFAIQRGYNWDDPYPGYGGLHKKMMAERERTQSLARTLADEVDEAREEATEALIEMSDKVQDSISSLQDALSRARHNGAEWDRSAAAIVETGKDAIATYRTANRARRNTAAPRTFSEDPFANVKPVASVAMIAALEAALAKATACNVQFKSQLAGARAQLESEYKSFYSDELAPFLRSVSDGAVAKVKEEFDEASVVEREPKSESAGQENIVRPRLFGRP